MHDLFQEKTEWWGDSNVHCCTYLISSGQYDWSDWTSNSWERWEGMEMFGEDGDIGLLLDLDEGTLSVF